MRDERIERSGRERVEALRQQRCHAHAMNRDERACGDAVVAPHGTARQHGEGGLEAAIGKTAAAIGHGTLSAAMTRVLALAPYDQRALDSHDFTRVLRVQRFANEAGKERRKG